MMFQQKKFVTGTKAEIDNLKPENKLINGTRTLKKKKFTCN